MTGPYDSILGRRIDRVLSTAVTFVPTPFDVATEDVRMGGALVEIDPTTGQATGYSARHGGRERRRHPCCKPPTPGS